MLKLFDKKAHTKEVKIFLSQLCPKELTPKFLNDYGL